MSETNQREDELFQAASKLSNTAQRESFLKAACNEESALHTRLQERLSSNDATMEPTEQPPTPAKLSPTVDHEDSAQSGKIIGGKYKLLNVIGEGGMGAVWMAEQRSPVKRLVALKLIKAGMDSKMVLARFEAERQALALMDHPNIARILDGGITESGSPYFVMELVKGVPITEYCDAKKLTPQQRLELFVPVCHAIQHAHQKGIIHRDIKPSNVMISLYDDKAVPKVIDFGVAKATGHALTEQTLNTGFGVVGTPQYMSPEQATFNQIDIDTRSDIYSLGVLLYELLAGSPPFQKKELEKAGYLEILRIIREEEPPRPSTKLSTAEGLPSLSATRSTEPKKLTGILRNELDWIVMKALEKDRSRRYETANAFAADVGRYLSGEAVQAHPPSQAYRLQKFFRKNKGPVLAASLVFLALLAGFVGTAFGLFEANKQRELAVGKHKEAEKERKKAEKAEEDALAAYRATTDDAIEQLIGSKKDFGPQEKAYLKNTVERWKLFADRQGEDERNRAIRAEGHYRVGRLLEKLGDESSKSEIEQALTIQKRLVLDFPESLKHLYQLVQTHQAMGIEYLDRREYMKEINEYNSAYAIVERLVQKYPDQVEYRTCLSNLKTAIATDHHMLGDLDQAIAEYREAIEIDQRSLQSFEEHAEILYSLALSHGSLAVVYFEKGLKSESMSESQASLELIQRLVARFPDNPKYLDRLAASHDGLANAFGQIGKLKDAIQQYQKAIAISLQLASNFPSILEYSSGVASSRNDLGAVLSRIGRIDDAIAEIEGALEIKRKIADMHSTDRVYDGGIPIMTTNLINSLIQSKRFDDAVTRSIDNEKLLLTLLKQNPDYPRNRLLLVGARNQKGQALVALGRNKEALAAYRDAFAYAKELVKEFPSHEYYFSDLRIAHQGAVSILLKDGSSEEARSQYLAKLDLDKDLVERLPASSKYIVELGSDYVAYGDLIRTRINSTESVEWYDEAIKTLQSALTKAPSFALARGNLAKAHEARALAYQTLEKYDASILDWDRAIELTPISLQSRLRTLRALSQLRTGKEPEAIAEADALAKRSDLKVNDWYNCACIYAIASDKLVDKQKELSDRAMESLSQAIAAGYIDDAHLLKDSDLDTLRGRNDFKQLLLSLQQSNDAKKLQKIERNDEALVKFQESIETCSKLAKELATLKSYCKLLADGHKGKSELLARLERRDEAKVENERRLRLFKELADQSPSQFEFRVGLIDAIYDYAKFIGDSGNHAESLKIGRAHV